MVTSGGLWLCVWLWVAMNKTESRLYVTQHYLLCHQGPPYSLLAFLSLKRCLGFSRHFDLSCCVIMLPFNGVREGEKLSQAFRC